MTATLCLVLGDQLTLDLASLTAIDRSSATVLICEVMEEARYVPHHPQKIAFLFSAMRHFAEELRAAGYRVRYVPLDEPGNTGSFSGEVARMVATDDFDRIVVTEPGEWRVLQMIESWRGHLGLPVDILDDTRFLCSHLTFAAWAGGRKQLRMEFFYREMRRQHGLLLEPDGEPTGGKWNYDADNRKPPTAHMRFPDRITHAPDTITRDVLTLVDSRFGAHFGTLDGFDYAVTRESATHEADIFLTRILPFFGDFQDAMLAGETYLYHARLSAYLNAGLLSPLDLCRRAEAEYRAGRAPLNAVEGFIRQILGWREFIRGIYWRFMPDYATRNTLQANRPLPPLYWGAPTHMACMAEVVRQTEAHAYSHHIQRLMVTGNFALLAGLDVQEVQAWYLAVYADAYEWVEMPNTLGMALHGDGGIVGSKPYAGSGKYIDRMSNFCGGCRYDPNETVGGHACPFNALYWDFLVRHRDRFRSNQRMGYVYPTWDKFAPEKQAAILDRARDIFHRLDLGEL
jgi:deoxyribodipyrimidine photolyase-related protein